MEKFDLRMDFCASDLYHHVTAEINTHDNKHVYHDIHCKLMRNYLEILNSKLGNKYDDKSMNYIAYGHDVLKDRRHTSYLKSIPNNDLNVPELSPSTASLVDQYCYEIVKKINPFTDCRSSHAELAAIWLANRHGIEDFNDELIAIMSHSGLSYDLYSGYTKYIQQLIDMTILADKLSSNYIKINLLEKDNIRCDLDAIVFGHDGMLFNFDAGVFTALLLAFGDVVLTPKQKSMIEYYGDRMRVSNPFVTCNYKIDKVGLKRKWPKRVSKVLKPEFINFDISDHGTNSSL